MPVLEVSHLSSGSCSDDFAAAGGDIDSGSIYTAKRFAIKFQPPCLFLEYNEAKSQKTRVRVVKLTKLSTDMDLDRLTRKVIRSFPRRLDPSSVKYDQVRKLVSKLVERLRASAQPGSFARPNDLALPQDTSPRSTPRAPELVPGGASPLHALKRGKQEPKDSGRDSTDSRFSTSDLGTCREANGKHRHPDLDEAMLQLEQELVLDASKPAHGPSTPSPGAQGQHSRGSSLPSPSTHVEAAAQRVGPSTSRFKQEAEETLVLEVDIDENTDLNKVSELELRLAKQQMEREFAKHQLRPGDPGYEYDKQVEFGPPTSENDWDDDDDD